VIIDEDGVYDPASPNDGLLLGMTGTMWRYRTARELRIAFSRRRDRQGKALGDVRTGHPSSTPVREEEVLAVGFLQPPLPVTDQRCSGPPKRHAALLAPFSS
jgi:hypothetical protein